MQRSVNQSHKAVAQIVIAGMMLGLAVVLEYVSSLIPFLHFPNGGSVSLVMVPLVLVSLFCGWYWGLGIGVAFGLINALMDGGFAYHWASIILDYVIGFGVVTIAGAFRKSFFEKKLWAPLTGLTLAGILRFLASFVSGVIVWNTLYDYEHNVIQPDFSAGSIIYSLTYNAGYMLPSVILSIIVLAMIIKPLYVVMDMPLVKSLAPDNLQKSKFRLPDNDILVPVIIGLSSLMAIISMFPLCQMYWLGYISAVVCLCVMGYLIYQLVAKKTKHPEVTVLFLLYAMITLILSIQGVLSYFTYGAAYYSE